MTAEEVAAVARICHDAIFMILDAAYNARADDVNVSYLPAVADILFLYPYIKISIQKTSPPERSYESKGNSK